MPLLDHRSNQELVKALADHLAPVLKSPTVEDQIATVVREDCAALGRSLTLSHWCDGTLGTQIVTLVNNELIKWCGAFLDEGHATWSMPGRETGSLCGVEVSGRPRMVALRHHRQPAEDCRPA